MSHPYHIVIAEASDSVRNLLVRIISRSYPNATLSAAADGVHAHQAIVHHGADVLIVSSNLPRLDAPDLIRTVRAQQVHISILVLSSDPALTPVAAQLGADCVLLKPFTVPDLRQALQTMLP